jgi:hypothetical protein
MMGVDRFSGCRADTLLLLLLLLRSCCATSAGAIGIWHQP